tara:strand:+ start:605 stop:859 length:255 start_codon:yes stop_codon:yes gene_type:complete
MIDSKCSVCRTTQIMHGYKKRTITKSFIEETYWCKEHLNKYLSTLPILLGVYSPKLRDTKIDKYNEIINSDNFIAETMRDRTKI